MKGQPLIKQIKQWTLRRWFKRILQRMRAISWNQCCVSTSTVCSISQVQFVWWSTTVCTTTTPSPGPAVTPRKRILHSSGSCKRNKQGLNVLQSFQWFGLFAFTARNYLADRTCQNINSTSCFELFPCFLFSKLFMVSPFQAQWATTESKGRVLRTMSGLNFAESGKISHCSAFQTEGRDWLALAEMSLSARVYTGLWMTWAEELCWALLWTAMCAVRK